MALPRQITQLLDQVQDKKIKSVNPGKLRLGYLYLMVYNPKWKKELPFYDILPLFFVLGRQGDRVLGVNIHYLPYTFRVNLAKKLMQATKNRHRITYQDIKKAWQSAKVPAGFAMVCIRSYLYNHIMSEIKQFDWESYKVAVQNVMPRFKKEAETRIYKTILQQFYKGAKKSGKKVKWTK